MEYTQKHMANNQRVVVCNDRGITKGNVDIASQKGLFTTKMKMGGRVKMVGLSPKTHGFITAMPWWDFHHEESHFRAKPSQANHPK